MPGTKTILFLIIGTIVMCPAIYIQAKRQSTRAWKAIPIAVILTVVGTIGTYLWFFIENGEWGGRSFYGAIFFVPAAFALVAVLLRVSYGKILDMCAPAICVMLVLMKVLCLIEGCCAGRLLFVLSAGKKILFPSQMVELLAAAAIFVMLLFGFRKKPVGTIYPRLMVLYGASRFVLNFFRAEWANYDGGMIPLGTVWSVVAVIIGATWLVAMEKSNRKADCDYYVG